MTPDRPATDPRTAQYFDPLAVMVGEFARDFVEPTARMDAIDLLYSMLNEARAEAAQGAAPRAEGLRDEHGEPKGYDDAVVLVHRAFCDPEHEAVGEWDHSMAEALRRNGYSIIDNRAAPRAEGLDEKIADRMALAYNLSTTRAADVAKACDEFIDPTGNLLGWLRDYAAYVRARPSDERVPESEEPR